MNRILLPAVLAVSLAAGAGPAAAQMLDRIVAVVNDGVVLQSELDRQVELISARLREQNTTLPPQRILEEQILERLVLTRIQLQRAESLGIRADDESLNRALSSVARRNDLTLSQLPRALAEQGIDYAEYREEMRREMILERLRARDVLARIAMTESEIEAELGKRAERDNSIEYNISHILISASSGEEGNQIEQAREKVQDLHERLQAGEDFAQLAVAYSSGSQALQGGQLGWKRLSEMPTLFVDIVGRMAVGEVSKPIPSPSGFHLIRVNDTRGAEKVMITQRHVRHILVTPNAVVSDDEAYRKILALRERILAGEDFAAIAKKESDDTGSANGGGDLGWTNPGTFVTSFEAALSGLQPGRLSEPVRTEYGWHVIELVELRDHDSTEELKRSMVITELRRQKQEAETERWLQRLRDEAYVEVRL